MRWREYTYNEGRVNRYGSPLPDDYDTLDARTRQSFAMMGNDSAKGVAKIGRRLENVAFDRWYARLEAWRSRE